jgi:hypothetical protein
MTDEFQEIEDQPQAEEGMEPARSESTPDPGGDAGPAAEGDVEESQETDESDQGEDSEGEAPADL